MNIWLAMRLARRELRAGARGFRILIACLALGVGTIAAVQSLSRDILGGLASQGRALMGGDVSVRLMYREATKEQLSALARYGVMARDAELRGMARTQDSERSTMVEAKAVDAQYPLEGAVTFLPPAEHMTLGEVLAKRDGVWGAAVEPTLLDRLEVKVGDTVKLGDGDYVIRAVIAKEPDRIGAGGFTLGPRFLVSLDSLPGTGLIQPGSMIYYDYRIALRDGVLPTPTVREIQNTIAETGWRVREAAQAAPQIKRFVTRLTTFLTLVGLTALLVGGVGVANAVRAYLEGRIAVIATMKCLGAPGALIAWTYLFQIAALSLIGIAIGVAIGAALPFALSGVIANNLPIAVDMTLHVDGLILAATYGMLIAIGFSLWPIGKARAVPAGALFRDLVSPAGGRPGNGTIAATGVVLLALIALVLKTAGQLSFSGGFVVGAIASFVILGGASLGLAAAMRRVSQLDWVRARPTLRLAVANIIRPGAATVSVVLSLGLGLTILVAIAQIESDFRAEVQRELPAQAPAFFFLDVQHADADMFRDAVANTPGTTRFESTPSLRGRIVGARGLPVAKAVVDRKNDWVLSGDRGITYSGPLPPHQRVVQGTWWPADYSGPPAVSVSTEVAQTLGLKLGDDLTVSVVGRDLTAKVANIREIDWNGLGINFALTFAPGLLEGAPQTLIATAYAPPEAEPAIQKLVNKSYPGVTTIGVRDALATVDTIISQIGTAVRLTAAIALVAGTLVLAGAIASGERRRIYDSVVLKVLGATRRKVMAAVMIEHGLLGLMAATIAVLIGSIAAWAVVVPVMDLHWRFDAGAALGVAAIAGVITLAFGMLGTWRALGQKAAPLLRNE